MPARNLKSQERAREKEPTFIIELLRDAHWQIRSLLHELDEILDIPTAVYELYPRVRTSLEIHTQGEEAALYGHLKGDPELAAVARRLEPAHTEVAAILKVLDRKPWKNEQSADPQWKELFRKLKSAVEKHIAEEEQQLFSAMQARLGPGALSELGDRYKDELRGSPRRENLADAHHKAKT